jgi:hypothetical protein
MKQAYGEDVPTLETVCNWYRRFSQGTTSVEDKARSGRPRIPDSVTTVSSVLEQEPFASSHHIASVTGLSKGTVLNILHNDLQMEFFSLGWVPHSLSEEQKGKRVQDCRVLVDELGRLGPTGLSYVLTSDESWFCHDNPHQAKWAHCRDDVGTQPRQTITGEKALIVVFWSFKGFSLVTCVPKDCRYTSSYFVNTLLPTLEESFSSIRPTLGIARTKLHWDNARPHIAKATRNALSERKVLLLPHPPIFSGLGAE